MRRVLAQLSGALRSRRGGQGLAAGLVLVAIGCGAQVEEEPPQDHALPHEELCEGALSSALIEHSCSHLSHGPFQTVAVSAGLAPPDVSTIHTTYDVAVASKPSALHYRASREGRHVLFTDKPLLWTVSHEGAPLAVEEVAVPHHAGSNAPQCPGVSHAVLVDLHRGEDYLLLGADPPDALSLFIEHTTAFGSMAVANTCK